MSARATERRVEFIVFMILVVLAAIVEAAVILIAVFWQSFPTGIVAALGALGITKLLEVFVRRMEQRNLETISTEDIKRLYVERLDSIPTRELAVSEWQDEVVTNNLIRTLLKFGADVIRKVTNVSHIELSIFYGSTEPRIICYYNSEGLELEWTNNRKYYREQKYFAVEFMDRRPNYMEVIPDTSKHATFSHVTDKQREKLKSVVVYVFCLNTPCALVIGSDKENTFRPDDDEMKALINSLGMAIHGDMHFMKHLCTLQTPAQGN